MPPAAGAVHKLVQGLAGLRLPGLAPVRTASAQPGVEHWGCPFGLHFLMWAPRYRISLCSLCPVCCQLDSQAQPETLEGEVRSPLQWVGVSA